MMVVASKYHVFGTGQVGQDVLYGALKGCRVGLVVGILTTLIALGFTGKGAIPPKQIATLNESLSPSETQIDYARRVIKAFEEGDSGLVLIDNKLIEKPVLRSMYRILAVAEAAQKRR